MKTKIQQSVLGGIAGTAVMTVVMFIAPMMGMPKMNPAEMLANSMGLPVFIGWIMHFMIGVIFALTYSFIFLNLISKITNRILKGTLFGLAVFVFAQLMMAVMRAVIGGMPAPSGSMVLIIAGSILGHIIYGIVVAVFIKNRE